MTLNVKFFFGNGNNINTITIEINENQLVNLLNLINDDSKFIIIGSLYVRSNLISHLEVKDKYGEVSKIDDILKSKKQDSEEK